MGPQTAAITAAFDVCGHKQRARHQERSAKLMKLFIPPPVTSPLSLLHLPLSLSHPPMCFSNDLISFFFFMVPGVAVDILAGRQNISGMLVEMR